MKTGKLDPKKLPALVFKYLGTKTDSVIVGPSVGEDAAVLDFGDKKLIVSSDPITGAAQEIGFYAININANDVSVMGAIPKYFLPVILLSENSSEKALEKIMRDMDFEAKGLGISIVGGHTEVTPELENIVIVGTMLGITDRIITSSGAEVGNRIILTKGAGIEGTSILARDKYNVLKDVIDEETLEDAKNFLKRLSVVKEALISKRFATAMHDATEGGVQGGLHELCDASRVGFRVDVSKIKVRRETKKICEFFKIDPLKLISSGSLIITVKEKDSEKLLDELKRGKVDAMLIGEITEKGRNLEWVKRDELWRVLEK